MFSNDNLKKTITRYFIFAFFVWSLIIGISLTWNIKNEKAQSYELALNAARANFNKDEAIRHWATRRGGVYVPPSEETPPNPYLAHLPYRDIVTTDGKKLTLMNPAYMIRNMMDAYAKLYGISGRIVGQVALNPNNLADEWESKAIDLFIEGKAKEVIETRVYKGEEQLRLIKPFVMKKGCVACHGHLGFKTGDIRGAIGISIPLKPYTDIGEKSINGMIISHLIIYILGLIGIIIYINRAYRNLKERKTANDKLAELNKSLDNKVKTRTKELEDSLMNLKETQKRLIETEKMSSLGSLVAGVAHEINTPIGNSLVGSTHIQKETKKLTTALREGALSKKVLTDYLDIVQQMSDSMYISLKSAATLVRSFKQVAIDQHIENKREFNLKTYADEVLLSLHSKIKHTSIEVINSIDANIIINSYAGIFSQTITNFIMNSLIHAYNNSSEIDGKIEFSAYKEEENLIFIYQDDGKGIDEKIINKIFDPFFTTTLGKGGSGLGLNIIYNLINHKLGATIRCESKLGSGTKMIITIPLKELELL